MDSRTEKYKNIIIAIVTKYLPSCKIVLYGSRARDDFKEGSDIDVALDEGHVIDDLVLSKIIGDLEESRLPIHFDLVDFWSISTVMQKEIMKDGVIWKK